MTLPHRFSLDCNYVLGASASEWWGMLRENQFRVAPAYAHRAAAITAMSLYNSALAVVERGRYGRQLRHVRPHPPVFIVGHWRSGTTYLLQLLAQDPRLCFPNAYQAVNPHNFLVSEALGTRLFGPLIPARRPPDNVALGFDLPEQDEYTIALASRCSPYLGHVFPENAAHYERFVTMRDATAQERQRFAAALAELVCKLTLLHDKPVLLKSPAHTGRVALLDELYPDARYVFIHRDPLTVFQSTRQLYATLHWFWYLQRPDEASFDDRILRRCVTLHEAWFQDRARIEGRVHEIAFADLERDPEATLRESYEALDLGPFEPLEAPLRQRLAALAGYRRNAYPPLDEGTVARVHEAWGPIYERWGY